MENTNKAAQEVVQETAQEEIVKAQESGVIDMGEKKEETKSLNYTHYFKKPVEIEGKQYKSLSGFQNRMSGIYTVSLRSLRVS